MLVKYSIIHIRNNKFSLNKSFNDIIQSNNHVIDLFSSLKTTRFLSLVDRLPTEESAYLKNKYCLLKTRLIKLVFRGIICNLVLLSIEQEFSNQLESYQSKTNRKNVMNLNSLRKNLFQLMRQLKAKTAENNMLIDYQSYLQWIHTNTIQQMID